jgi:hypothetical protein
MSQRTWSLFVFGGLAAAGLSLNVSPGVSRIIESACNLHSSRSQTPPSSSGGAWCEVSRILEIDREIAIKNDLAADLIAGRRTLDEVTNDFLLILRSREIELTAIRCRYQGDSDREKVALTVLKFARGQPGVSDEALARVEAEFHSLFPRATTPTASIAPVSSHERSDAKQNTPGERHYWHEIGPVVSCQ